MFRATRLLACSALLPALSLAQCPSGDTANIVPWDPTNGYASSYMVDDEGLTSPPVVLPVPFTMPGATGTLDRMWVCTNGELYFTDSTLGLTEPVGAAFYGITSVQEMRGITNGASARIAVLGTDLQRSVVPNANWHVTVDSSSPDQVVVTWTDVARFANTTDRFSFQARLVLATGVVQMSYGASVPPPTVPRYVGISIGNNVGAPTTPSSNLSATPDSASLGLLFESFGAASWDLSGTTLTLAPNGNGGYAAAPLVPFTAPICATAASYGFGCTGPGGPLSLMPQGPPRTSTTFQVAAAGFGPLSIGVAMIGFTRYEPGFLPLTSIAVAGPGVGCDLLHSAERLDCFVPMIPVGGNGTFNLPIPSGQGNPTLLGLTFYMQVAEFDFSAGWIGTFTTNALACTIGEA